MQRNVRMPDNQSSKQAPYESALEELYARATQLRRAEGSEIERVAGLAYDEDPALAVKLFFHLGDERGGKGEREIFQACMDWMVFNHPEVLLELLPLIPAFARWDQLIRLTVSENEEVAGEATKLVTEQFLEDVRALGDLKEGKAVQLSAIAKWMPSSASKARNLLTVMNLQEREYEQAVNELCERLRSAKKPVTTNSPYLRRVLAEKKHDYLQAVLKGEFEKKEALKNPANLYHDYAKGNWQGVFETNEDYEVLWQGLSQQEERKGKTIATWDESNSMTRYVGRDTSATMLETASALTIYFAERLDGAYQNQFITFSDHPRLVDLGKNKTLADRMLVLDKYEECSSLDLNAICDVMLEDAVSLIRKQEELPEYLLVMSDVSFDAARGARWNQEDAVPAEELFATIREKWVKASYKMPKIVYWNLNGKADAVSEEDSKNGVIYLNGFSKEMLTKVMEEKYEELCGKSDETKESASKETSLREEMLSKLSRDRYDVVEETTALAMRVLG